MICKACGYSNASDANFCSSCGVQIVRVEDAPRDDATATFAAIAAIDQPEAVDEAELASQVEDLAAGDAMLVVKKGTNVGATYLLDTDVVTAGRNPSADVFLDDVTVSRKHAEFRRDGGSYKVVDVGSLNGTYVNGELRESDDLAAGDEVQIGKFKLVFLLGAHSS